MEIGVRKLILGLCLGLLVVFAFWGIKSYMAWKEKGKIQLALSWNRVMIEFHLKNKGEYPILKGPNVFFWDVESRSCFVPPSSERVATEPWFNPVSGQYDWLAEDASGTLYSPKMPDSVLMASPPIRVVNIRCPLTASEPPFFEDFTKW